MDRPSVVPTHVPSAPGGIAGGPVATRTSRSAIASATASPMDDSTITVESNPERAAEATGFATTPTARASPTPSRIASNANFSSPIDTTPSSSSSPPTPPRRRAYNVTPTSPASIPASSYSNGDARAETDAAHAAASSSASKLASNFARRLSGSASRSGSGS
eukprot:30065-Pelagococcus_subviridis.AAC.3